MIFYVTIPPSLKCHIRPLKTALEIFTHFTKLFRDSDPIEDPHAKKSEPSTNKVKEAGTATEDISADTEKPRKSLTSENAAAEMPASADACCEENRDERDLPNTKDLRDNEVRGTQHVNSRNAGSKDPCTSNDVSQMGSSAKCADGMAVLPEGMPHEM